MNLENLLKKWSIKCDVNTILSMWNESHRHYHTLDHLNYLLDKINEDKNGLSEKEYEMLILTSLFHDCIYDPMKPDNEEKSAEFFENCCVEKNEDIEHIKNMILETKTHKPSSDLSKKFCSYDMNIINESYDKLLEWEEGIYQEYKSYGDDAYKFGRLNFLESLLDKEEYMSNTKNLLKLIEYVKSK